jgi:hypothetical protein
MVGFTMPDYKPLRTTGLLTDALYRKSGDLSVNGDLIEIPNAQRFNREEYQQLLPRLEKLAKDLHNVANKNRFSVDVVSLYSLKEYPDTVHVLIKPAAHKGDPRGFTIPRNYDRGDLENMLKQIRTMLPSA